jgi:hypothetical protein
MTEKVYIYLEKLKAHFDPYVFTDPSDIKLGGPIAIKKLWNDLSEEERQYSLTCFYPPDNFITWLNGSVNR